MKPEAKKELVEGLVWGAVMVAVSFGGVLAHRLGYIDHDTTTRLSIGVIGLYVAWVGNRIPKRFTRSAAARQVQRVAAWSQVLGGLTYVALWTFAPIPVATWGGCAAILASLAITFGYCLSGPGRVKAG
ncbi:MAG TPA: ammonium transporter [Caulobacteraceae bacterium]|nr:ammonium transporter [Caulobacteraceae bacterium]